MPLINTCRVDDQLFGELGDPDQDEIGSVDVSGKTVPRIVIRRADGAAISRRVPIGTRRAEDLSLSIDGEPAEIAPSPGRFTRRSYRIDVVLGGTEYQLAPSSSTSSRLWRDAQELGDLATYDLPSVRHWHRGR